MIKVVDANGMGWTGLALRYILAEHIRRGASFVFVRVLSDACGLGKEFYLYTRDG